MTRSQVLSCMLNSLTVLTHKQLMTCLNIRMFFNAASLITLCCCCIRAHTVTPWLSGRLQLAPGLLRICLASRPNRRITTGSHTMLRSSGMPSKLTYMPDCTLVIACNTENHTVLMFGSKQAVAFAAATGLSCRLACRCNKESSMWRAACAPAFCAHSCHQQVNATIICICIAGNSSRAFNSYTSVL